MVFHVFHICRNKEFSLTLCRRDPEGVSYRRRLQRSFQEALISSPEGVRSSFLVFLKGMLITFQIINMEFSFCMILLFVWRWITYKYHKLVTKKDWRKGDKARCWICSSVFTGQIVCYCTALCLLSVRYPIAYSKIRVIDPHPLVSILFEVTVENERAKRARVVRHSLRAKG